MYHFSWVICYPCSSIIKYSKEPRISLWGTPALTFAQGKCWPINTTLCFLQLKKSFLKVFSSPISSFVVTWKESHQAKLYQTLSFVTIIKSWKNLVCNWYQLVGTRINWFNQLFVSNKEKRNWTIIFYTLFITFMKCRINICLLPFE